MPSITLELLTPSSDSYSEQQAITIPIKAHIHKRLEYFRYLDKVGDGAIKLDHIINESINSKDSLDFHSTSNLVPQNSQHLLSFKSPVRAITGNSITLSNDNVIITNKTIINKYGKIEPVWYKINLPTGALSVEIQLSKNGKMIRSPDGFEIDLSNNCVWSNKRNYYDFISGNYELYFITVTNNETTIREIASFEEVVKEATWEDIDLDTGALRDDISVYTKEEISGTTVFYFSVNDTWYIKKLSSALIKLNSPLGYFSDENWFPTVSNGKVYNSRYNKIFYYTIPEYNYQNFTPYKPYKFSYYKNIYLVNKNVLKIPEETVFYERASNIDVTLYIYDAEDNLLRVLTTDPSLEGQYYSDTLITYESDRIISVSTDGFIYLDFSLESYYKIYADYYYESKELELNKINLNPVLNRFIEGKAVVYYIIPNVTSTEEAIHYLVLDKDGMIVDCSQSESISYPNLKLKSTSGTFNSNTVIGKPYFDDEEGFLQKYSLQYNNDYGYFVLGLIGVNSPNRFEDFLITNVINSPGLDPERLDEIFAKNPRLKYSASFEANGKKELPRNSSLVIELPLDLLQDYGGNLSESEIITYATKYIPTGIFPIIHWIYPTVTASLDSISETDIVFNISSGHIFNVYQEIDNEWTNIADGNELTSVLTISELETDSIYKFQFRVYEEGIEYPSQYTYEIRTK